MLLMMFQVVDVQVVPLLIEPTLVAVSKQQQTSVQYTAALCTQHRGHMLSSVLRRSAAAASCYMLLLITV